MRQALSVQGLLKYCPNKARKHYFLIYDLYGRENRGKRLLH